MTVTDKDVPATKGDLDTSFEDMKSYVDTAVDTLTEEMDRQFKEVRGDIAKLDEKVDKRFDEVLQAIRGHSHG